MTPIFEKSDEQGHYGYVLYLREHRALPPLEVRDDISFEYKQPPLYYGIVWALSRSVPGISPATMERNPYVDLAVPGVRGDNRAVYLHPPYHTPLGILGRVVSLLFGTGTMAVSYFLAMEVFPRSSSAPRAVAAIVGFQPRFLYVSTAVSNDASAAFFGAALTLALVRWVRRGARPGRGICLGSILGLAILAKSGNLLFVPLSMLALVLAPKRSLAQRLGEGLAVLAAALAVGGWWYLRNAMVYGDPLTIIAHLAASQSALRPLSDRFWRDVLSIEYTFWANLARTTVAPLPIDKTLIWWGRLSTIAVVVAAWRICCRRRVSSSTPAILILLAIPIAFWVALVGYWTRSQAFAFGRLLLPALSALTTLWVLGWHRVLTNPWRSTALCISGGLVVCAGALIPFVSILPLYHPYSKVSQRYPPDTVDVRYHELDGREVARLVGYRLGSDYTTGGPFMVELCWLPLGRTDTPYAVLVQVVDASQISNPTGPSVFASRRTYPGLGSKPTDRWVVGGVFCDRIWVPITWPAQRAPRQTLIEVGFIDATTENRLAVREPDGSDALAMLPGPSLLAPGDPEVEILPVVFVFDHSIVLYRVETWVASQGVAVRLFWQSRSDVPYDAVVFVHVRDRQGALISQLDVPPASGQFDTSAWVPNQKLTDLLVVPLPEESVGPYFLQVGLYERNSLQRLPVTDGAGRAVPDSVILCGPVSADVLECR